MQDKLVNNKHTLSQTKLLCQNNTNRPQQKKKKEITDMGSKQKIKSLYRFSPLKQALGTQVGLRLHSQIFHGRPKCPGRSCFFKYFVRVNLESRHTIYLSTRFVLNKLQLIEPPLFVLTPELVFAALKYLHWTTGVKIFYINTIRGLFWLQNACSDICQTLRGKSSCIILIGEEGVTSHKIQIICQNMQGVC